MSPIAERYPQIESSYEHRATIWFRRTVPMDPRYPVGKFQQPLDVTPVLRQQAIEIIAETPARVRAAVGGLSPLQLDTPYRQGGLTVCQVIHHWPHSHVNAYVRHRFALTQ